MKIKKKIPLIDQANKLGFWGGKFGGNYVPETLKKPIEDLEILFNKLKIKSTVIYQSPPEQYPGCPKLQGHQTKASPLQSHQ